MFRVKCTNSTGTVTQLQGEPTVLTFYFASASFICFLSGVFHIPESIQLTVMTKLMYETFKPSSTAAPFSHCSRAIDSRLSILFSYTSNVYVV